MNKALFLFVFALAAVECADSSEDGDLTFSGMGFTMTCPNAFNEHVTWKLRQPIVPSPVSETVTLLYNENTKGEHHCTVSNKPYYFYVQGKVCANCYELDGALLLGFIFVDLLVTGGIIIVIYNCARRKSASAPSPAPASGRPGRGIAPSVPDRDYEQLNHATRDTATYAVAAVNRTG